MHFTFTPFQTNRNAFPTLALLKGVMPMTVHG